jgi:BioD-like phosphotransacetylase family protein
VIINRVPGEQLENIRDKMIPLLSQKGVSNIAVLPEDQFLSTRSIKEIAEIISGKVICCKEFIDRTVTALTVGTSCLHQELSIFKRVYNKIILLGPSSGCPEIAGIILTGNREIPDKVLKIAQESKIPLILVKKDIFTNSELLEKNMSRLSPKDENKVIHFTEMMDHNDFLNSLIMSLGIVF